MSKEQDIWFCEIVTVPRGRIHLDLHIIGRMPEKEQMWLRKFGRVPRGRVLCLFHEGPSEIEERSQGVVGLISRRAIRAEERGNEHHRVC